MIVIFEGLDNCGKTTLVSLLYDYYVKKGIAVEMSKEFETNIGIELKNMAKSGNLDSVIKSFLFATDRYIRMKNMNFNDNTIILFDRYVPSAIAYRMAEGIDKEWISALNSIFPKADIGFYIDISGEKSVSRNSDEKFNIKASKEHLNDVRNAYLSILEENNLIYIDGNQPQQIIFEQVVEKINEVRKTDVQKIR